MAIEIDRLPLTQIASLCQSRGIRRLALFGSALRDDFGPQSDLDILVEFDGSTRVGLAFFAIQEELSTLLGRKVDLHTPGFLSRHFRDQVLVEAHDLYVAA